jgi:membrane peptidoglycan carboxypeptidase
LSAVRVCKPCGAEFAAAAGIDLPPPEKLDLSLALDTATVTPIELANAYAIRSAPEMRLAPRALRLVLRGLPPEIGRRGHSLSHETK